MLHQQHLAVRALRPLLRCFFATRAQLQRPMPHSKAAIQQRKPQLTTTWGSHNGLTQPHIGAKYLRHAERIAWELGVVDDIRQFDEAAAAYPNPPKLIAATVLERGNLITRDLEEWEAEFLAHKFARQNALAKHYPQELLDLWTVKSRVMEKSKEEKAGAGKKGAEGGSAASGAAAAAAGEGGEGGEEQQQQRRGGGAAAAAAPQEMGDFYEARPSVGGAGESMDGEAAAALLKTPRQSSADAIGDTRSLERAYSQRLVLLVCSKSSGSGGGSGGGGGGGGGGGTWGMPGGEVRPGEKMVQAAERCVRALFGAEAGAYLDLWYPSPAPIGHFLSAYPPHKAEELQCYGERVFFYRAEILQGRLRLPEAGAPPREGCPYSDFQWLTRDESEALLPRPLFKYLHQVMGGGAGEEAARGAAWQARCARKGRTVAAATAARAARVRKARVGGAGGSGRGGGGTRMPAVATRAQCELAARPWDGSKAGELAGAVNSYHARRREQRVRGLALRDALAFRPQVEAIRASLAAARAKQGAASI